MSSNGDYGGGPNSYQFNMYPGNSGTYHFTGGYPEQHGGSFGQGPQMGSSWNGVQNYVPNAAPSIGRSNSPSREPSQFERLFLPARSSFREDNKPIAKKRIARRSKAMKGACRLEDSVDDLRKRIEKLEGEVRRLKQSGKHSGTIEGDSQPEKIEKLEGEARHLKRSGKRSSAVEVDDQSETKVAKTEPQNTELKVIEGKVIVSTKKVQDEKSRCTSFVQQTLDYTIDDGKIFVCAAIDSSLVRMEVPLEKITRDGQPVTLDLLEENLGSAMRVYFHEHERGNGEESWHIARKAELLPHEKSTVDYLQMLRSKELRPFMAMKGNFTICSPNWIRISCYIDGKVRQFDVPYLLISDRSGNLPIKRMEDLKQELKPEINFKFHRAPMDDEIVYFLTYAWVGNRSAREPSFEKRVPNIEGTEIHIAEYYSMISRVFMSVTTVIHGKEMSFNIPAKRVKFEMKYCKRMFEIKRRPKCYLYLRKIMKDGKTTYFPRVAILECGLVAELFSAEKPLHTSVPLLDESGDQRSFIIVDELHNDDKETSFNDQGTTMDQEESAALRSTEPMDTGRKQTRYSEAHKDGGRALLQESVSSKVKKEMDADSEETHYSVVQEDDEGIFQPVSLSEGYVHWKDQVFRVQPSDIWQEEVPFTNFDGLSPSPTRCRVAVIQEVDSTPHYELVVAALGELPSAESIMKVIKGQAGVLKFPKKADHESMAVEVDGKEYPIAPSQLFLIGKSVESIDEAKEYYTRKVTVLFHANGNEIRLAFHPTRPDVCPVDRCLIEVSPFKTLKGSRQVHVLTGKYKGAIFSYADNEFEELKNFRVLDCDISLKETNAFVLGDFNLLDTKPVTVNPVRQESRITLSRKFNAHIRKNIKSFFDFHSGLQLTDSTSPTVVGMKVVQRLLAKLDSVVDDSLTEVVKTCFQECFPGRSSKDIQSLVGNYMDGIRDIAVVDSARDSCA